MPEYSKAKQLSRGERRYRRKVASKADWRSIREEKIDTYLCRICFENRQPLQAHHLVPRSALGDDVAANIVPLCFDCHGRVTARKKAALLTLSERLLVDERAYVVGKLGEGAMQRLFGV